MSLVILNVGNLINREHLISNISKDYKQFLRLIKNVKKLIKNISFKQAYQAFFEKNKIKVLAKINGYLITYIQENILNDNHKEQEYAKLINKVRVVHLYLWVKLAILKRECYKKDLYVTQKEISTISTKKIRI